MGRHADLPDHELSDPELSDPELSSARRRARREQTRRRGRRDEPDWSPPWIQLYRYVLRPIGWVLGKVLDGL